LPPIKESNKGLIDYVISDWVLVDQVIKQFGINGLLNIFTFWFDA